jgi:glycosyltransferase involved in cell wall biosynthesis
MKISIITPSYNQCTFLRQTMQSVLSQAGDFDLEWLVIDGASSDETINLLSSTSDPRLRWISEKDRGQADAINKGLALATGQIIGWLNSDDLYTPGALNLVAGTFRDRPGIAWLAGRCAIIDEAGNEIRHGITAYKNERLRHYTWRNLLRENPISQPAVFWRRSFGQSVGSLDTSLHHAMDYDLWLRMGMRCDPYILKRTLAQFRLHSSSKSGTETASRFAEQYEVAQRYFDGDRASHIAHWVNVQKIVWAYRVLGWMGK